jgi:hypothetical protein
MIGYIGTSLQFQPIITAHTSNSSLTTSVLRIPQKNLCLISATRIQSQSYVTTDGRSATLSWNTAPIWGLRTDLYYCQTVADLLIWGALSDERTGLSFTIAVGPRQRIHSRVRVSWDWRPYFTVFRFETSLFVASYDSQGYGGGIRPRLHTENKEEVFDPALPFITAKRTG